MPAVRFIGRGGEGDDAQDELTSQQTCGRGQSDPAGGVDPTCDPGKNGHPALPADDGDPMILATRRRIPVLLVSFRVSHWIDNKF